MICLHPISAISAWRLASAGIIPMPEANEARSLRGIDARAGTLEHIPSDLVVGEDKVHLMVSERGLRHDSPGVHCHLMVDKGLPEGSFAQLSDDVLLPSVELCFALMAKSLSQAELLRLGMELCGRYRKVGNGVRYWREQLTSSDRLVRFAGMLEQRGSGVAGRAAARLVDGSGSPRESVIALMCTLPTKLGGYQLPKPAMNLPMDLDGDAQLIAGQYIAAGDLYWEKSKLIVEYDSDQAHAERRAHDVERRDGIESMGIRVITITTDQARDFSRLDACIRMAAKHIRGREIAPSPEVEKRRRELYRSLVAYSPTVC